MAHRYNELNLESARYHSHATLPSNSIAADYNMSSRRFSVLIVDDSAYNLFVMKELMTMLPIVSHIETALNGVEAIAAVKAHEAFDIIFLDIHMPIMDGNQTVKALREMHMQNEIDLSQTKIIALSAITDEQFREQENNHMMFDSFIEKPVEFERLRALFYN